LKICHLATLVVIPCRRSYLPSSSALSMVYTNSKNGSIFLLPVKFLTVLPFF
jgi:hypothetical protein